MFPTGGTTPHPSPPTRQRPPVCSDESCCQKSSQQTLQKVFLCLNSKKHCKRREKNPLFKDDSFMSDPLRPLTRHRLWQVNGTNGIKEKSPVEMFGSVCSLTDNILRRLMFLFKQKNKSMFDLNLDEGQIYGLILFITSVLNSFPLEEDKLSTIT